VKSRPPNQKISGSTACICTSQTLVSPPRRQPLPIFACIRTSKHGLPLNLNSGENMGKRTVYPVTRAPTEVRGASGRVASTPCRTSPVEYWGISMHNKPVIAIFSLILAIRLPNPEWRKLLHGARGVSIEFYLGLNLHHVSRHAVSRCIPDRW